MSVHTPVLLQKVIEYLRIAPESVIVDATLNGGGHTRAILEQFPGVRVIGIEWDPVLLEGTKKSLTEFGDRFTAVNDSYVNMERIVGDHKVSGVLFDLGLSSWHYEESGRGFSFMRDEPLDMRFDPSQGKPAKELLADSSEEEIARMLREYGEEQFADEIAKAIHKNGPIQTTTQLVEIIGSIVPEWYKHRKIHFATKTFQALRVAVNDEMGNVERGIQAAINILQHGGRLVAISFQGKEDKTVRKVFKDNVAEGRIQWVTKDTIRPTWNEIKQNPRARSAKMKIAEKLDVQL